MPSATPAPRVNAVQVDADLESVPGIGPANARALRAAGIISTQQLIGKFLMLHDVRGRGGPAAASLMCARGTVRAPAGGPSPARAFAAGALCSRSHGRLLRVPGVCGHLSGPRGHCARHRGEGAGRRLQLCGATANVRSPRARRHTRRLASPPPPSQVEAWIPGTFSVAACRE